MGLSIKLFAFGFITLMLNGWYTDVTFKNDKSQEEFIFEELVEYNIDTKEGRVVSNYANGSMLRKGWHYLEAVPKLSGQFNTSGTVYYVTRCNLLRDGDSSRKRCDTYKSSPANFNLAWNRYKLVVSNAKSDKNK